MDSLTYSLDSSLDLCISNRLFNPCSLQCSVIEQHFKKRVLRLSVVMDGRVRKKCNVFLDLNSSCLVDSLLLYSVLQHFN